MLRDGDRESGGDFRCEWTTLGAIMAISLANYVLGVWRPSLAMRWVVR
jgi:hypothetical protein